MDVALDVIGVGKLGEDGRELGLGVACGGVGRETADDGAEIVAAAGEIEALAEGMFGDVGGGRDPEIGLAREGEVGRHDADDREWYPVRGYGLADDRGGSAELGLPVAVRDDGEAVGVGLRVGGGERAAEGGAGAEDGEEVGCDDGDGGEGGVTAAGDGGGVERVGGEVGKRADLRGEVAGSRRRGC